MKMTSINNSKKKFRESIKRIIAYLTTQIKFHLLLAIFIILPIKMKMVLKKFLRSWKQKITAIANILTTEAATNLS